MSDPTLLTRVGEQHIRDTLILPTYVDDKGNLHVIAPQDTSSLHFDALRAMTQARDVIPTYRTRTEVEELIQQAFDDGQDVTDLVALAQEDIRSIATAQDVEDAAVSDSNISKLVNQIIRQAIDRDASDIHIHPYTRAVRIRFREDGVLRDYQTIPRNLLDMVVARVKILSRLDIAIKREPQDGRIATKAQGRTVELRVSTIPTVNGEKVVMRILKNSDQLLTVDQLGFANSTLERFIRVISQPYGMFLVTGPTGSGKSFTLFSAMKHLNTPEVNIHTVEDPVEYTLDGLAQTHVNPQAGVTFASALRSLLRQDPDIIMVGEIRDLETAHISVEAALTGHLMLATLHTNNAAGAITRLKEMGVEPFNIAGSLLGVLAQRLVRRVCKHCAVPAMPSPAAVEALNISVPDTHNYHMGQGCDHCNDIGYRGRIAIHELLTMSGALEQGIMRNASTDELTSIGESTGMHTLRADAIDKAFAGITTLEEVLRVTAG